MLSIIRLCIATTMTVVFLSSAVALEMPEISQASIVARYGKPDRITSAENERPRPPLITKMIDYKKENVRFVLIANAPLGSPPPYKSWKLMGYQDLRNNKVLTGEEVQRRLSNRVKKK